MIQKFSHNYIEAVKTIKRAILQSRYKAAVLANRELLLLYYGVGKYISQNSRNEQWGTNAIEVISRQLENELPGLRGFSATSLKKMRTFYEAWENIFSNRPLATDEIAECNFLGGTDTLTDSTTTPQHVDDNTADNAIVTNRSLITDDLAPHDWDSFFKIGFTHHYEIISKTKTLDERLFYIQKCAAEFWSVEKLKYNLKSNLYAHQEITINNFAQTISQADFRGKALRSFKDEYLLDFINIEDPDEMDERVLEHEIVLNIKKFIMTLGDDFSFMGNQHRIVVDEKTYFIDLLFFNRKLQSLIAIELKRGEFKPEYVGQLNFYLSALDEYVKMPHENPSIGIILCKSRREKTVEFAFRDITKPMGVATYRTARELPLEYKGILPDVEKLKELMDE
jgi:predicted nuclease of restriction endonuclease-like (RecB) superfamily